MKGKKNKKKNKDKNGMVEAKTNRETPKRVRRVYETATRVWRKKKEGRRWGTAELRSLEAKGYKVQNGPSKGNLQEKRGKSPSLPKKRTHEIKKRQHTTNLLHNDVTAEVPMETQKATPKQKNRKKGRQKREEKTIKPCESGKTKKGMDREEAGEQPTKTWHRNSNCDGRQWRRAQSEHG